MTVNEPYMADYTDPTSQNFNLLANNISMSMSKALQNLTNENMQPRVVAIE